MVNIFAIADKLLSLQNILTFNMTGALFSITKCVCQRFYLTIPCGKKL